MNPTGPHSGTFRPNPRRPFARCRRLLAVLAVLPLLLAGRAFALDPTRSIYQYNCQNWTRHNGLPANKINSITQTRDGYLWLGTPIGLVRFSGLEFKAVPIDLPQAQGQEVRQLVTSGDGQILFAIMHGGFGRYDGKKFSPLGDERWAQPGMEAITLMEARDGAIWTGADLGTGRWLKNNPAGSLFTATNTGIVLSLCQDPTGRIWLGTPEQGFYYWEEGKFTLLPDRFLAKQNVFAMAAGADGRLWVGTSFGLSCYAHGRPVTIPPMDQEVKALLMDRHGVLWVGTARSGLARYENGEFSWLDRSDGLGSDYITSLYEDAEGSLWVGTRDGLSQLSDEKFPIYSDKEGLGAGGSHTVAPAKDGGLWISTESGFSHFDGRTFTNYTGLSTWRSLYTKLCFEARNGEVYEEDAEKNINVFAGNRLLAQFANTNWTSAITEDAQSVVVATGTGSCLYRIHGGKEKPYQYHDSPPPDYYWVNNLCVARDGALWVASKNGIYRLLNGDVKRWSTTEGLSGDIAQSICQDADGSIWAGLATGIARIKDGQVKNIRLDDGLADNWIYAIVPDDGGDFWFDSVCGIFRVSRQNLNDFADGKTNRVQSELFDGLEAIKYNGRTDQENSGCKTPDGRVWFPCPWGVVMIDPAHLPTNRVAPAIHIDRLLANGREFARSETIVVPPGKGEIEIHFSGLSFIAPEKIQYRYQLAGYDKAWVDAGNRRVAFYTNLKPGPYVFSVSAANADGIWNPVVDSLKFELRPHFHQTVWFYLLCIWLVLALLAVIYAWRVRHLELKHRALQQARDELESEVANRTTELARANASLQHEVEEHRSTGVLLARRTQLLESEIAERERMQDEVGRVHQRLLETSRQAGMAEVATNVLHNVGNVLNSVNVSAALVAENAKNSKVAYVGKVVALLDEHAAELGTFITTDPKGRQLPGFLSQLAGQLAAEQQQAIKELDSLRRNIEHIKDIVAMQQNYAKISGVVETVKVTDLVEDALAMNTGALARHGVELIRDFSEVPPVSLEKHKVLQILVNLIRNAKYACDDSGRTDKQIRLEVARSNPGVRITVADNGVGIPPENLTRIFDHGFTTRKGGHGFGLHSGALTAKELGGTLTAHSDGPRQGATFTLTLPLQPSVNES